MQIETTQVRLRMVTEQEMVGTPEGEVSGKEILHQMKTSRVWRNDDRGKYASVMFDGHEFKFRQGATITVGVLVANALRRSSAISIGPDFLNGPIAPFLIVDKKFELGEETEGITPTTCPVCRTDQHTLARLARHVLKHEKDHPQLTKQAEPEESEFLDKGEPSDGGDDTESFGQEKE